MKQKFWLDLCFSMSVCMVCINHIELSPMAISVDDENSQIPEGSIFLWSPSQNYNVSMFLCMKTCNLKIPNSDFVKLDSYSAVSPFVVYIMITIFKTDNTRFLNDKNPNIRCLWERQLQIRTRLWKNTRDISKWAKCEQSRQHSEHLACRGKHLEVFPWILWKLVCEVSGLITIWQFFKRETVERSFVSEKGDGYSNKF